MKDDNHGLYPASLETARRWFAVYTTTRHEKRIFNLLANHRIETFLPLYRVTKQWKKRSPVVLDLPLFPNYVFVHMTNASRGTVSSVPGVLSIVGGRYPCPLPDLEIEALRSCLDLHKIEPHPYLVVGDRVRIKTGPFTGMDGVLVRRTNNLRVVLSITMIMQSVAVEIDAKDVELLSTAP